MIENVQQNEEVMKRLHLVTKYLHDQRIAMTDRELANLIKVNTATLSLILNGKTRATEKFVLKLCNICDNLNFEWIMTGNGTMLKGENASNDECKTTSTTENLTSALKTIEILVNQMAEKDRQIGKLIDMMSAEKNTAATKDVTSAAASE